MASPKPKILAVLGADRVGKSTLITNTYNALVERNVDVKVLHFSGPKPHHNSPIDQYIQPFQQVLTEGDCPEVFLFDRGFSEVNFYEQWRRHTPISEEWTLAAESYFASNSYQIAIVMVKRSWEWAEPHHIVELKAEYPDATNYFLRTQLNARKAEHHAYYEYMEDYLTSRSSLYAEIITPGFGEENLLRYCW